MSTSEEVAAVTVLRRPVRPVAEFQFGDTLSQRRRREKEDSVMSETGSLPDLGRQVRPMIQTLPVGVQPRIMATLERAAAERYRTWAGACPEPAQAEGLRACAAREEEVAACIEMAFPSEPDEQRHISGILPKIAEAYRSALAQRPVITQYDIQAAAERRGAAYWRTLASSIPDASVRDILSTCAELEERSAEFLEAIVNRHR